MCMLNACKPGTAAVVNEVSVYSTRYTDRWARDIIDKYARKVAVQTGGQQGVRSGRRQRRRSCDELLLVVSGRGACWCLA